MTVPLRAASTCVSRRRSGGAMTIQTGKGLGSIRLERCNYPGLMSAPSPVNGKEPFGLKQKQIYLIVFNIVLAERWDSHYALKAALLLSLTLALNVSYHVYYHG